MNCGALRGGIVAFVQAISFEGLELGAGEELEASIAALLEGRRRPRGQDTYVHQWLARLWNALEPEHQPCVARCIARQLTSPHARTRSEAIRFFQSCPANDEGALLVALETRTELYEGVEDPIAGATADLRGELLRAIANDLERARRAIERLRLEALRPGGGTIVLGLLQADPSWVRENAATIVKANPGAYQTLLVNFALHQLDLSAFIRKMRPVFSDDAAEMILRERLATQPEKLARCLAVLRRPVD